MKASGLGCQSVASPIGKSPVSADASISRRQLANCLDAAKLFEAPFVRIFGFQYDRLVDEASCRARIGELCRQAATEAPGVRLLLENERDVYGERPEQIRAALESASAENLAYVCDPANFAVVGIDP